MLNGTCTKCGTEYTAKWEDCRYQATPQSNGQSGEGYFYVICSDCGRRITMKRDTDYSTPRTHGVKK